MTGAVDAPPPWAGDWRHHPDNLNRPNVNKASTIWSVLIVFTALAAIAVLLRLIVRARAKLWGWDDFFVNCAAMSTVAGSILVCQMPGIGMGYHFWTLPPSNRVDYYKNIWGINLCYTLSATLIKLAILFQYLRLFDVANSNAARRTTVGLIILVTLWGTTFFLLALFACWPIAKNWNFMLEGTCVAWGSKVAHEFFATFIAHAALNMLFDILVFVLPLPFLKGLRMQGKTRLGLFGLFAMGALVVALSIARMVSLSLNRIGTVPVFDPSFSTPTVCLTSSLEISIAIITASIPIFWPLVQSLAGMNKILVVQEFEVRTDRRDSMCGEGVGLAGQGAKLGTMMSGAVPLGLEMEMGVSGRTSRVSGHTGHERSPPIGNQSGVSVVPHHQQQHHHHHHHHHHHPHMLSETGKTNSGGGASKRHHHRSKSSTASSSDKSIAMELGRRISQESQRGLNSTSSTKQLAHHGSSGALSLSSASSPDRNNPLDAGPFWK